MVGTRMQVSVSKLVLVCISEDTDFTTAPAAPTAAAPR